MVTFLWKVQYRFYFKQVIVSVPNYSNMAFMGELQEHYFLQFNKLPFLLIFLGIQYEGVFYRRKKRGNHGPNVLKEMQTPKSLLPIEWN